MIERRHGQRSVFEAAVGSVEKLVEGVVDPAVERLDHLLADERLVEAVVERLAQRRPRSRRWGRPGTPAEVVLRMLALKRLKGWSFADTEREVRISLVCGRGSAASLPLCLPSFLAFGNTEGPRRARPLAPGQMACRRLPVPLASRGRRSRPWRAPSSRPTAPGSGGHGCWANRLRPSRPGAATVPR